MLPGDDADDGIARTFALMADAPDEILLAIFLRYGRPLAVDMPAEASGAPRHLLTASDGSTALVRLLRILGFGDVIPNDYLVLEAGDADPVAVPAPHFSAALTAVLRAAVQGS